MNDVYNISWIRKGRQYQIQGRISMQRATRQRLRKFQEEAQRNVLESIAVHENVEYALRSQ